MSSARVLFIGDGRLGNQVFQYAGLRKLFGAAGDLYAPTLGSLVELCEGMKGLRWVTQSKRMQTAIRRIALPYLARPAFKYLRLGKYLREPYVELPRWGREPEGRIEVRRGISDRWVLVDDCYCQNLASFLTPTDFADIEIKSQWRTAASELLRNSLGSVDKGFVAMHVRRGDYLIGAGGRNLALGGAYFRRAHAALESYDSGGLPLVIVTDDQAWSEQEFQSLRPALCVSSNQYVDFAVLAQARMLILSNSTFSLAAACMSTFAECIIAPEYWLGHSIGQWIPPNIRSSDPRFCYVRAN